MFLEKHRKGVGVAFNSPNPNQTQESNVVGFVSGVNS